MSERKKFVLLIIFLLASVILLAVVREQTSVQFLEQL
jgi:hypothetical protein